MKIEEIISNMKTKKVKAQEFFKEELQRVRTGRASISILDIVKIEYYDSLVPLSQVATLSTPESRLILIQPWDVKMLSKIEKAILQSGIGLTPNNDGKIIRIPIPPLTQERRLELAKLIKKMAEESRVRHRNIRRDANEMMKELEKKKELSQDELKRHQKVIEDISEEFLKKVEEILQKKTKEIMEG